MTLTRDIIGHAECMATNAEAGVTAGRTYRVVKRFTWNGIDHLSVLNDRGNVYAVPKNVFGPIVTSTTTEASHG